PRQLHLPAFIKQPPLDKLGDVWPSSDPNGRRGMAEAQNPFLPRAVRALGCRLPRMALAFDRALDDSRGDRGIRQRVDQDEASRGSIEAIGIEDQRQGGL